MNVIYLLTPAKIPRDKVEQEFGQFYDYSEDMRTGVRRNIPAIQNTNIKKADVEYLQKYAGDPALKNKSGREYALAKEYESRRHNYTSNGQDQFNLQSSSNTYQRARVELEADNSIPQPFYPNPDRGTINFGSNQNSYGFTPKVANTRQVPPVPPPSGAMPPLLNNSRNGSVFPGMPVNSATYSSNAPVRFSSTLPVAATLPNAAALGQAPGTALVAQTPSTVYRDSRGIPFASTRGMTGVVAEDPLIIQTPAGTGTAVAVPDPSVVARASTIAPIGGPITTTIAPTPAGGVSMTTIPTPMIPGAYVPFTSVPKDYADPAKLYQTVGVRNTPLPDMSVVSYNQYTGQPYRSFI